jgi:hypothetical protein
MNSRDLPETFWPWLENIKENLEKTRKFYFLKTKIEFYIK